MLYRVGFRSANLLKVSLVTTAAMSAICLLALVETTNAAEAKDSLPENGKIAFSSGEGSIYTVEPDGSNVRQLTNTTHGAWQPIWSPDGRKIAFYRQDRTGETHISVMSADGSNRKNFNTSAAVGTGLTWSPNGTKLAFSRGVPPNNYMDIFMMDADGSNQINLTKSPGLIELYPDFSPNGSHICFSQYSSDGVLKGTPGIYVMDADGSDPTLLLEVELGGPVEVEAGEPCDWSPDGTKIAFHAVIRDAEGEYRKAIDKALAEGELQKAQEKLEKLRGEQLEEVYVMNADGTGRTALTDNSASDINPRWSPDGTKITFARDWDGKFQIYTMDADGSDIAQVTNARDGTSVPDWQPLPGTTSPKDTDGSDADQGTKKPGVDDVDRDLPERTVIVKPGDSLWSISEQRLGPQASPQRVYDHADQMYALNRKLIGSDPDLIFAGQRLSLPPRYVTH
jgi:Tol biopolymer transport system component